MWVSMNLCFVLLGENAEIVLLSRFEKEGLMFEKGAYKAIHPESWLLADHIMRELFLD